MIPFSGYKKEYIVNKSIHGLEEKFNAIESNPSAFYDEINIKLLNASLKTYRVFVPVTGRMVFGLPVMFSKTRMIVQLIEQGGKTKIVAVVKANPLYLLMFVLTLTSFAVNYFWHKPQITLQGFGICAVCITAAIITDSISKNIVEATFERFI